MLKLLLFNNAGSLMRKFAQQQFYLLLFGLLFAFASSFYVRTIEQEAQVAKLRSEISLAIERKADQLRTWHSLGLKEAIEQEVNDLKNLFPIVDFKFVNKAGLPSQLSSTQIQVPRNEDQDLDIYILANFKNLDSFSLTVKNPNTYIAFSAILILIVGNIFLGTFFFAERVYKPLTTLKEKLNSAELTERPNGLIKGEGEIAEIINDIIQISQEKRKLLFERDSLQIQAALGTLASQVSHDIRSPLSALNMITSSLQNVDTVQKELIQNSIQRINDIANDLLKRGKNNSTNQAITESASRKYQIFFLNPLIDSVLSEKRLQYKNKTKINIVSSINNLNGINFLFAEICVSDLKRALSNLINNSIEAIGDLFGTVEVSLEYSNQYTIIKIIDDGPGIPTHILQKLGYESVSFGKVNSDSGNGLGVLHAKKTIERMQGLLLISSTPGKGTEIQIKLPLAEKPPWFLDKLMPKENSMVLVCDDDSSIIALWKKRLSEFPSISTNYFTDLATLSSFLRENQDLNFNLLIDYEFSGEQKTGLDFIIENELASNAILVTSHYDEDKIIQSCLEHGIKQIPKNICALVPIEMASAKEYYDAVVLDDEDLQIRSWQFAAIQKGKKILTFNKSDEFLSALSNIDHLSCIFIDSILSEDIKGEDIAKKVSTMGFKNIYMSSGHDPSYFKDMKFLKGIIGKTPVFP